MTRAVPVGSRLIRIRSKKKHSPNENISLMGSRIAAIEYHFPPKKITNQDLSEAFPDYDFSKFEKKVGIVNRYVVEGNTTALDLAQAACLKLLTTVDKSDIDFVLYCTQSPTYYLPTTACILQQRLGLPTTCGAFDFNLGCSGFTYGLGMAKGLIESGQAAKVLLVTAETYTRYIHPKDKSNKAIFGDAAAATLVVHSETDDIGPFLYGTNGAGAEHLIIKNGCSLPYNPEATEQVYGSDNVFTDNHLYMNGPEIFTFTAEVIPGFVREVLEKYRLQQGDIDQYIFHQANSFMLNHIRKQLDIPQDRFYIDLADGGNTVSSTIPIALKRYLEQHPGNGPRRIMLVGFGVGLSWSGGVITI